MADCVRDRVSTGRGKWVVTVGGLRRTYFCGAFDVLGVAADEGGLLLVGGGHCCVFCVLVVSWMFEWVELFGVEKVEYVAVDGVYVLYIVYAFRG